jgi:hypothetical protein
MHYFLPECQPTGRDKNIISKISEKAFAAEGTASCSIQKKKKKKVFGSATEIVLKHLKKYFRLMVRSQQSKSRCMVT